MKNVKVSQELYDKLKDFVVDPFDDTAETIIERLVDIANKAKQRWSAWEDVEGSEQQDDNESAVINNEMDNPESVFRSKPLSEATAL